jgi:hypothetical protein
MGASPETERAAPQGGPPVTARGATPLSDPLRQRQRAFEGCSKGRGSQQGVRPSRITDHLDTSFPLLKPKPKMGRARN